MKGVGCREEVVWELEADVQGHKKGAPRGSCGSVGGCGGGQDTPRSYWQTLGRERPQKSRDRAETHIWRPGSRWVEGQGQEVNMTRERLHRGNL